MISRWASPLRSFAFARLCAPTAPCEQPVSSANASTASSFPPPLPIHPFDLRHGVDTSGLLFCDQLASGHAHDDHINAYWGTPPSGFQGILDHWQQALAGTPYTIEDYTLVDIGCGKGRVVLLASDLPFQRIVGVELNPTLTSPSPRANLMPFWNGCPAHLQRHRHPERRRPRRAHPGLAHGALHLQFLQPVRHAAPVGLSPRPGAHPLRSHRPHLRPTPAGEPGRRHTGHRDPRHRQRPLNSEDRTADAFASKTLAFRIYRFAAASDRPASAILAETLIPTSS